MIISFLYCTFKNNCKVDDILDKHLKSVFICDCDVRIFLVASLYIGVRIIFLSSIC
jgi:hypothetical protein